MSTWELIADDGNNFRWELSPNHLPVESKSHLIEQPSSLPSTSDLFLHGISKLSVNQNNIIETPPTFRTGLGKSFPVKSSSLAKAMSILGGEDDDFPDTGQLSERDNGGSFPKSMFQTGSGKAVNISLSGLVRAKTLLGLGENNDAGEFKGCVQTKDNTSEYLHPNSLSNLRPRNGRTNIGFEDKSKEVNVEGDHSVLIPPMIRFHTAGGRSISVSGDALQRARGLLGDPELGLFSNEGDAGEQIFNITTGIRPNHNYLKKETGTVTNCFHDPAKVKETKNFISPVRSSYGKKGVESNLIKKFDEEEHESTSKPYIDYRRRSSGGQLVDISNTINMVRDEKQSMVEKRKLVTRISVPPFKRPRTTKFDPPLNRNSLIPTGLPSTPLQDSYRKHPRKYFAEYFGVPPYSQSTLESLPDCVRRMNPEKARKYVFHDQSGLDPIGVDTLFNMLVQSGCSPQCISKGWITNHYKWIVWKLACYERSYPARFSRKLLTVFNVLKELKYRYDKEVNHSHRSALKKILEGDAPPSSMMVLCISSIHLKCGADTGALSTTGGAGKSKAPQIELTDGWYSVNAILDEHLSVKLATRKLFVGQKIRICGATLCDWGGPVSPLEESRTISLRLQINGTYRTHWADRLGFCKGCVVPLAFRCIMSGGGAVPCTLVGITRIYPILYKERLHNGGFVIRSERTETKIMQLYDQMRSDLAEGIISEQQRGIKSLQAHNGQTIDEEEELFRILETADEPDIIMAEMSLDQLASFASYQKRQEAMMQSDMQQSVEKAVKDGGRDVISFRRVRVVGLTSKTNLTQCYPREGLITIWNSTEKQESELVEGQTYAIAGLVPMASDSNTLYLQARGSTTKWRPLSPSATKHFQPFLNPRKPILLSKMGEVPLCSEFDIAAFVIHVGEVSKTAHQKIQWVFVSDGSSFVLGQAGIPSALLAIRFCSPVLDSDSIPPINFNLTGSTVGFCNLIKKDRDNANNIWLADATDNSTYFLTYDNKNSAHLKDAAFASNKWARVSSWTIAQLKKKALSVAEGRQ